MKELIWLEPTQFWFLISLPLFLALIVWGMIRTRQARAEWAEQGLFRLLQPGMQAWRQWTRAAMALAGMILIILAMARLGGDPQPVMEEEIERSLDIMLLVDLSSSMQARDLNPNRMEATKIALKTFVGRLRHDRVGLVVFAGTAAMQAPLTKSYETMGMMVDMLNTNFLPVDGTAMGDGIEFGLKKIGQDRLRHAVMILLTDGENTRGQDPLAAARKAREAGTRIYTIGVGTPNGAKIPVGEDEFGNTIYRTYHGEEVITKLDAPLLEQIAQMTGGRYFPAESSEALINAYAEINRLTKGELKETKRKMRYQEHYAWFAVPALFLLLLDLLLGIHILPFRRKVG
jgi:Ca-activated chloride channel family protein